MKIIPGTIPTRDLHQFLLGAVAPRPIAFASTIDENGIPNLAPFSFFNAYSSNPPILVFSANRRVQNNTTKDTLANVERTGEVVINVVNYAIVHQMAVASVEFPSEINEFQKSGLTPVPSETIRPFRVKESPVQMECKVDRIIPLGDQGGAGYLIVCKVTMMHIADEIIDDKGRIDPHKIDLMGRMGRSFYVRCSGDNVFPIVQEVTKMCIGYDQLPETVRNSTILSGNDIGRLAGMQEAPAEAEVLAFRQLHTDVDIFVKKQDFIDLHRYAQQLIQQGDLAGAAKALWAGETTL
jgi:flavin reductase (DIM6/NTAB) family NADH-FMN oxidoreductase RutF